MSKREIKELIGTGQKQITMDQVPLEKITEYACEDADAAYRLRLELEPQLKELEMKGLFIDMELPLISVLADMEEIGVMVDKEFLAIRRYQTCNGC